MRGKSRFAVIVFLVLAGLLSAREFHGTLATDHIGHYYLTYQGSPQTTITVNYHTEMTQGESAVFYDTLSHDGDPASYGGKATGASHTIPGLRAQKHAARTIHAVELRGLAPGTTYYFVVGNEETGYSPEEKFRTLPADGSLRMVVGGDMSAKQLTEDLMTQAAATNPMLALLGGDIAYADGDVSQWEHWEQWLDLYQKHMVTPDGRLIPIIFAIGNHEANGDSGGSPTEKAPFYFGYFAQHGAGFDEERRTYFSRHLTPDIKLLVLDTAHVTPMDGTQKAWLDDQFASAAEGARTIAAYHIPMYPSHRDYQGDSRQVREEWLDTFDENGLTAAFEHHEHMHKRTRPLRGGSPHQGGTVYFGDGCFGRDPYEGRQAQALEDTGELARLGLAESYLASWSATPHFWLVEVETAGAPIHFSAIDKHGDAFDTYQIAAPVRD